MMGTRLPALVRLPGTLVGHDRPNRLRGALALLRRRVVHRASSRHYPSCIPERYHVGMSTQIAVRLPDELVAYVDRAVAEGRVRSRAELVARLIERDARRQRAEEDLAVLAAKGVVRDPDALAIARATSATPVGE
jgi:Arc/MetJ-type ribon-helix-helix transcriptional regulator